MNPFDFVNSISENKEDLFQNVAQEKDYNAFLVNRALSQYPDTVLYAQDMNAMPWLDAKLQYDYLLHSVQRRKRRAQKWPKPETEIEIDCLMKYFGYRRKRAEEAYRALRKEDIEGIVEKCVN